MNLQNLMKQAQSMQKKIENEKEKIDNEIFEGKSELITIKMSGTRKIISAKIKEDISLNKEDIEILEDMIVIAVNDAISQIDNKLNKVMGSQMGGLSGLL